MHTSGGRFAELGTRSFAIGRRQFGKAIGLAAWLLACISPVNPLSAAVSDTVVADVTTRAFSVIWVSDEPVLGATVRVYSDVDGLNELTWGLVVDVPSATVPTAHERGIVKVGVSGLDADAQVYVQTETTSESGTMFFPATAPLLPVRTALEARRANVSEEPIVNDLISHDLFESDGLTPGEGALLLVDVPGVSEYPVSSFVGEMLPAPAAVADMNNLYEEEGGVSADLAGGEAVRLTAYRGLACAISAQRLVQFRRMPIHEENPPITELETAEPCFDGADFNCDSCVDPIDFNEFLIQFGQTNNPPDCAFNSDFDLSGDGRVDPVDFNEFLMAYGVCE